MEEIEALVLQKMAEDRNATVNALISNYQYRIAELEATLKVIRDDVTLMLKAPWTPSTHVIEQLVFNPSRAAIESLREEIFEEMQNGETK